MEGTCYYCGSGTSKLSYEYNDHEDALVKVCFRCAETGEGTEDR